MMTSFGFNDAGGGTAVPRLAAKELARRGWEVTVFHAATRPSASGEPYEVLEWMEDGVRLLGVHNRAHGLWDLGHPLRELEDPPITAAFAAALDRLRPQAVHFHNLSNLGAALIDQAAARGLPAFFSTHNYWLICPRAYLMRGDGEICAGPGDGGRCAECVGSAETEAHRLRLQSIRARFASGVSVCLAVSEAMRRTLIGAGYPAKMIDVVRQAMPHDGEIWEQLGRDRAAGRAQAEELTVGFLGSAYPHKGPLQLVQAAQRTRARVRVQIHGEIPEGYAQRLREADGRGVLELCGSFEHGEIGSVLAAVDVAALPSRWWDCAPLAAAECLAARLPLLAPRLGGLAEAVQDGVNGLLFEPLNADDLARCLDRLALEDGLLERMQQAIAEPRRFADYVDELEAYYGGERPGRVPRERAAAARLAVSWQGDHGLPTSLSIINQQVAARLPAQVQRVASDGSALDPPLPHAADVEVRHQWPPQLQRPASGRLAVIQPWEFGALPSAWLEPLQRHVDELWVPSEYVRAMYLAAGIAPERVAVLPNGVDLELFSAHGDRYPLPAAAGPDDHNDGGDGARPLRFLFVGGLIWRKGPDVLLEAFRAAFAGSEEAVLVVKDFGADGIYREGERAAIADHAAAGALPRVLLIEHELSERELAALYRACDVLVHPYRGEGFAMPVLEAMACARPVIVTAGGPTDEFCPPQAGWRIRSTRTQLAGERVGTFETAGRPWVLEPDAAHLAELLRAAFEDRERLAGRGAAARGAAERLGWDEVARRYEARLLALCERPRVRGARARFEFEQDAAVRVLATPAWRGEDSLDELLERWCELTDAAISACLYLLADPRVDGSREELGQRVLASAAALEQAADVTILIEPVDAERHEQLHAAVDAYVPLHGACEGHARMARAAGTPVLALAGGGLEELLAPAGAAARIRS